MKDMDYFRLLEGFANQLCNYIVEGLRCVGGACVAKFYFILLSGQTGTCLSGKEKSLILP